MLVTTAALAAEVIETKTDRGLETEWENMEVERIELETEMVVEVLEKMGVDFVFLVARWWAETEREPHAICRDQSGATWTE